MPPAICISGIDMFFRSSLIVASIAALGTFASGCRQSRPKPVGLPPVPVKIGVATKQDVPVRLQAIGAVQTINTVSVKALASGELKQVGFAQGDEVHAGQMLFVIDPSPYQVALAQAEAALARDSATNDLAQTETQRYTDLAGRGLVSSEQNQQEQSTAAAAAATVRADQAAVNAAKLNLSYCTITSPIEGRTGKLLVQPGNLIAANTTVLVTINQLSPIYASFSVPQQYLDALRAADRAHSLQVSAATSGQAGTESGDLSFINNAIDSTTATLQLMARFPNREQRLWPGQYVNIELTLSVQKDATVVPATAVLTGPDDLYVYILAAGQHVERRPVLTGPTENGVTVITHGVEPGETVVTDGQLQLSPGAAVKITPTAAAAPGPGTPSGTP